jgi:GT2 family glycosyltransferase
MLPTALDRTENLPSIPTRVQLSIIFVNWNSLDYLRESIASVYQFTCATQFEIIVVDNASPEGGVDAISQAFPGVIVIKSPKNLGFAGANNLGFAHSTGEFVLLLNPDTQLFEPSIDIMMDRARKLPNAGIIGCKLLNTDRTVQLTSIQSFPSLANQILDAEVLLTKWPKSRLWGIAPLFDDGVDTLPVQVITGACMLLRREVFEQVGRYSEDYFMYGEDLDLNYKVAKHGLTNYYVGATSLIHHGGRSSSRQRITHWATVMKYKAMVLYFRKTRGRFYEWLYRSAIAASAICRIALLLLMRPFANILWDKNSISFSADKWKAVLKWALGDFSPAKPVNSAVSE